MLIEADLSVGWHMATVFTELLITLYKDTHERIQEWLQKVAKMVR